MSTPRRYYSTEEKAIDLKFNSKVASASDTQTITSIPLPQHQQIDAILVLKDGRIAILENKNLAIYSDTTAFERPPVISILLPESLHFGRMIELSENQIICCSLARYNNSNNAILCDLSNKSAKLIKLPGIPQDISALNDTQFIVHTEKDIYPTPQRYLSLFRSDANGSFNEISRLDLSSRDYRTDRHRFFCPIPATTTVIIEDRKNLGNFNVFKQVDEKGWDRNKKTTVIPNYPDMDINPRDQYVITANLNGDLLLGFRSPHGGGRWGYNFCIIDSAFQGSNQFYINEFQGKGISLDNVEDLIFLPDAKTIVASATSTDPHTEERMSYLLTLNIDHGYSFVKMPRFIGGLSLLPSGEILIKEREAFFSTFDSKYMKDYRAQIAQHAAGVTQLPSAIGNIVTSYLFQPSVHNRKQWVDGVPMQPDITRDDLLSEADINPVSPEVKLALQSNARRIEEFVTNATAYINKPSSFFHNKNSPQNIAETAFLRGLISRFNSSESKSINTAEIKNAIHAELVHCYTSELKASVETIITPVRFSGLGRVGVESLLEMLLNSVSVVAQIKAKRIEAEKLDAQLKSTASSSSTSSTSPNKRGE